MNMEDSGQLVLRAKTPPSTDSPAPAPDADESLTRYAGRRRTKKWAPRATTGCLTCRLRHVKCDEVRPECGRCLKLKLKCHFDRHPAVVHVALETPSGLDADRRVVALPVALGGLTSLQRDWIESYRQFGIILNFRPEDPLIQSPAETQAIQAIWAPDRTMASRIRFVLAHCFAHHIRPGLPPTHTGLQLGDAASMRRKFSHYTGQILADLGADMGDPASYREKQILTRVSLLMAGDISLSTPTLRHHLRGWIAVVEARGGIRSAMETGELSRNALFLVMMSMIVTNTTSPSFDQMAEEVYFTNEDIYAYYADELIETFTCPTQLFLCIRDINHLRREMAGGRCNSGAAQGAVQAVFRNIMGFEPDAWRERYELPAPKLRLQLAALYKAATMLYGMMTLAAHAGVRFDTTQRIASADAILQIVLALSHTLGQDHLALVWPLMVVGASLGGGRGGSSGRRAIVDSLLLAASHGPCPSAGVFLGLECLRRFWKSGKTEWDECFTTWQATIP